MNYEIEGNMQKNTTPEEQQDKKSWFQKQRPTVQVAVITTLFGFAAAVLVAIVNLISAIVGPNVIISATKTAEALATTISQTEIAMNTKTPTMTVTVAPTLTITPTATIVPTVTITPTATSVLEIEPTLSTGYIIYDTFDTDQGKWEYYDNWVECHRDLVQEFGHGILKFECFGSKTKKVNFTIVPSDSEALTSPGVELAFYTLPSPKGQWGKYQLLLRFGSDCGKPERGYVISILPNKLTFIEVDRNDDSVNPPSPTRTIGTLEPHVIKIEFKDNFIYFYLDGIEIRKVAPLDNTSLMCWMFQSQDNGKFNPTGYRGIELFWVAIKP